MIFLAKFLGWWFVIAIVVWCGPLGLGRLSDMREDGGDMPVRIQRKRTRGWRMPLNTIYCRAPDALGQSISARSGAPHLLR